MTSLEIKIGVKRYLRMFLPPIVANTVRKVKYSLSTQKLFDGDDWLFKKCVKEALVYGEYGVGKSTDWVYENSAAHIICVDTSFEWVQGFLKKCNGNARCIIDWVDLGEVGDWGYPLSYEKRGDFVNYAASIWEKTEKPDVVLIDGRFRVFCFFYSLLHGRPGTKIIFDDYRPRRRYHVVEEVIKPVELCGRQALFVVPEHVDENHVKDLMSGFAYVIE
jgi:hypothetical protein